MAKTFRVKLVKSVIGCTQDQREAVRCLGLKKTGSEVKVKDHPATRGQIFKVQHLLEVNTEK
jgi:large subunit ribosomal protein L30